jgi:hypothetical protein
LAAEAPVAEGELYIRGIDIEQGEIFDILNSNATINGLQNRRTEF